MDKVQEIMALVDDFKDAWTEFLSVDDERLKSAEEGVKKSLGDIESKLRALLERKPLTDGQMFLALHSLPIEPPKRLPNGWVEFARAIERAHGIGA